MRNGTFRFRRFDNWYLIHNLDEEIFAFKLSLVAVSGHLEMMHDQSMQNYKTNDYISFIETKTKDPDSRHFSFLTISEKAIEHITEKVSLTAIIYFVNIFSKTLPNSLERISTCSNFFFKSSISLSRLKFRILLSAFI